MKPENLVALLLKDRRIPIFHEEVERLMCLAASAAYDAAYQDAAQIARNSTHPRTNMIGEIVLAENIAKSIEQKRTELLS